MATSILLLDCTDDLANRLKALGHEVHVGTSGYCTKRRRLNCQIYETDLVIYDPRVAPQLGLRGLSVNESPAIDFGPGALLSHVARGGHWLAFLNPVSENEQVLKRTFSWLPMQPEVAVTLDQKTRPSAELERQRYMDPYAPLVRSSRSLQISSPVRLKISKYNPKVGDGSVPFEHLLQNLRGEPLSGVCFPEFGSITFMPKCENNDDAAVFYVDYVWSRLKPAAARGGLPEEFQSPVETKITAEIKSIIGEFEILDAGYHDVQRKLGEATQEKRAKIAADETAQIVLRYYREAEEDQKNAHVPLFKVLEVIGDKLGGETTAKKVLGNCNEAWNALKRLTNESGKDARHAPKPGEAASPMTGAEMKQCFDSAKELILGYFRTLFP